VRTQSNNVQPLPLRGFPQRDQKHHALSGGVGREEFYNVVVEEGEPGGAEALGVGGEVESGETGIFSEVERDRIFLSVLPASDGRTRILSEIAEILSFDEIESRYDEERGLIGNAVTVEINYT